MSHVADKVGGYVTEAGLYRVPDLVTAEQMVDYMWNTYQVRIKFIAEQDIDGNENEELKKKVEKEQAKVVDALKKLAAEQVAAEKEQASKEQANKAPTKK